MTISLPKRLAVTAFGGLVLFGAVGVAPASAKAGDVRKVGTCTGRSTTTIKIGPRDGRLETEFEVDSNRNGQQWSVTMTQNGAIVASGTKTTVAPSGSFTVRRVLTNRAGTDTINAAAKNLATGEWCVVSASI